MPQNKVPVRPANRDAVYDVLDGEREYQNETFPDSERSLTRGEYLLLLEEYIFKARAKWSKEHEGQVVTDNELRKIGGIVVRAMEKFGPTPREYHVPASANITGELRAVNAPDALAPSRKADPRRSEF